MLNVRNRLSDQKIWRLAGITGEEEEEVEAELRGVKLFVKRGTKEFSGGMLGHVKLLTHTETREQRLGKFY